jgi:hypothetical protein
LAQAFEWIDVEPIDIGDQQIGPDPLDAANIERDGARRARLADVFQDGLQDGKTAAIDPSQTTDAGHTRKPFTWLGAPDQQSACQSSQRA